MYFSRNVTNIYIPIPYSLSMYCRLLFMGMYFYWLYTSWYYWRNSNILPKRSGVSTIMYIMELFN